MARTLEQERSERVADHPQEREPTLSDHIYDQLLGDIIKGVYATGARLPSETAMAKAMGVSRPVVRAALARLREDGIISTRQGSGNYVARRPDSSVPSIVPLNSMSDIQRCYEFRLDFEPACAAWAAQRRTEEQMAALSEAVQHFEESYLQHELGTEADLEIHKAVARCTGNPFHVSVMDMLARQVAFGMHLSRSLTLHSAPQRNNVVEAEHRAILDAIVAADPEAARDSMRVHLEGARDRMFIGEQG
ncbi:FadR family transcriptional regulator [Oceanicola sp. D3]|nr:FadR family transcriptional regulator [Oceanicola sp. D3]